MKKSISLVLIGILIISGFGAVAIPQTNESVVLYETENIELTSPIIVDRGEFNSIELAQGTSYLLDSGKPFIPRITKVYKLPFKTIVNNVFVDFSEPKQYTLTKQIQPSPEIIIDGKPLEPSVKKSEETYSSFDFYPNEQFNYRTCTGLDGTEHVVYLSVQCYPIQYIPAENILFYHDSIEITIEYETPKNQVNFPDMYDLVIIAPSKFEQALQPLIDHKISKGMNTTLKTTEDIYNEYTEGRDKAENIKLFIKDAIEEMGVSYVLLVGGRKGHTLKWYLPVRNTNNHVGDDFESGVDSDLYFSDIYKNEGTEFEDWDSNGNDIFAEFRFGSKDTIDGAPDVYVGRLACTSLKQVKAMVNKIIEYEENKADESWFKNMILIGGDTYPDNGPSGAYEAEIDTDVSAGYMTGFDFVRLWASTGALTGQKDVEDEISNGAGFVHMAGHANPSVLVTYPPDDVHKENKITIMRMYDIFNPLNFHPTLKNKEKQPVCVIGGCHNSQINVSAMSILKGLLQHGLRYFHIPTQEDPFMGPFWKWEWIPNCFSWWLTVKSNGGAIATMGNTGLGMGIAGFAYPEGLDGWLLPKFFYNLDVENGTIGEKHVGAAHSAAITDYINEFDINSDDADRQMVEQWILLGDPSLVVGGY
jgi:hypothetical protein